MQNTETKFNMIQPLTQCTKRYR